MRSKLAKKLRSAFDDVLKRELPQFRRTSDDQVPSGWRLYQWMRASDLYFFVMLVIDRGRDYFTIDIGFSRTPRLGDTLATIPDNLKDVDAATIRLGLLYNPPSDVWWMIAPEPTIEMLRDSIGQDLDEPLSAGFARIEPQVIAAVAEIRSVAMPFFNQVAGSFGYVFTV